MKTSFLDFIDSDTLRDHLRNQTLEPAIECILIVRSRRCSIEKKLEVLKERYDTYSAEDFNKGIYNCREKDFKSALKEYIDSTEKVLDDRYRPDSNHVYNAHATDDICFHGSFDTLEAAIDGIKNYQLKNDVLPDQLYGVDIVKRDSSLNDLESAVWGIKLGNYSFDVSVCINVVVSDLDSCTYPELVQCVGYSLSLILTEFLPGFGYTFLNPYRFVVTLEHSKRRELHSSVCMTLCIHISHCDLPLGGHYVIAMILYAPRSSGPQAYADGYSAVSAVLPEYYFASIFRGFEQICRGMPLQKNVPHCRKSVGKI